MVVLALSSCGQANYVPQRRAATWIGRATSPSCLLKHTATLHKASLPATRCACWAACSSLTHLLVSVRQYGICAHSRHFWHKPVHETGQPAHLSSACCSLTAGSSTHSDKGQEVATPATSLPLVRVLVPPLPELPCTHNSHPQQRPKAQRGRLTSHPAACPWLHKSPLPPTRPTASSESITSRPCAHPCSLAWGSCAAQGCLQRQG